MPDTPPPIGNLDAFLSLLPAYLSKQLSPEDRGRMEQALELNPAWRHEAAFSLLCKDAMRNQKCPIEPEQAWQTFRHTLVKNGLIRSKTLGF